MIKHLLKLSLNFSTKNLPWLAASLALTSCVDFWRKEECEWYLTPEPKHKELVKEGWVSLCARNYELGRQQCYLAAKIDLAERMHNKPFRYKDLKLDTKAFPRTIIDVKACESAKK